MSPSGDEGSHEGLLDDLRTFASEEARLLTELESMLVLLRNHARTSETFDEQAIWAAVERSLWGEPGSSEVDDS